VTVASGEVLTADAVVIATPAEASAFLLMDLAPDAAAELARIESADVVVVTFAVREVEARAAARARRLRLPGATGSRGRAIKASTFSFAKWDWVREAGRAPDHTARTCSTCARRWVGGRARAPAGEDHLLEVGSLPTWPPRRV
jgi:oxygen-dependent protoporphyrinogen oxidase